MILRKTALAIPLLFTVLSASAQQQKVINYVIVDGGKYKGEFIGNGRYSDITVFSFHPVKIITTGDNAAEETEIGASDQEAQPEQAPAQEAAPAAAPALPGALLHLLAMLIDAGEKMDLTACCNNKLIPKVANSVSSGRP